MNLTVGFDTTWLNVKNIAGGVFQYTDRLITALVNLTDINVVAMVSLGIGNTFNDKKGFTNFKEIYVDSQASFLDVIEKERIDVLHTPIMHHQFFTVKIPMLTTLHDLQHFHYPEFFTKDKIKFRNIFFKKSAELSERVIVSFDHVKDDIIKFFNIPHSKIDICSPGIDPPKQLKSSDFSGIQNKYEIPEQYLFYSANTWRHKNHIKLIQSLKTYHDKYSKKICLICTGQKTEYFSEILKEIKLLDLNIYVRFLGYLPENELLLIMNNAKLIVIPTLYEAGSYPLLEAMSYGIPVICSNVTSLPECIGDERFIFNPNDVSQITEKIYIMLNDQKLRNENIENSKKQVATMRWEKRVNTFVETYKKAIDGFERKKKDNLFPYEEFICNYEFLINNYYSNIIKNKDATINSMKKGLRRRIMSKLKGYFKTKVI